MFIDDVEELEISRMEEEAQKLVEEIKSEKKNKSHKSQSDLYSIISEIYGRLAGQKNFRVKILD
jgi:isopropylmalate/homocitrate/citramalate synthase